MQKYSCVKQESGMGIEENKEKVVHERYSNLSGQLQAGPFERL